MVLSKNAVGLLTVLVVLVPFVLVFETLPDYLWHRMQNPNLALAVDYSDAEVAWEIGNYYFNGGAYDIAKAQEAYERALAINPKQFLVNYQLGRVYFVEGKSDLALQHINTELTLSPYNLRSLYVRGLIETYQNNFPAAESDFTKFVSWAPSEWAGYNDLSYTLAKGGTYQQAAGAALSGIRQAQGGTTNPWLWNSAGVAYLNMGLYSKASDAFQNALNYMTNVTDNDWIAAYPGNDPSQALQGIATFTAAIRQNLSKTNSLSTATKQ